MESEVWVKINENGRIVIPAAIRQALDLHAGEEVGLRIEDGELRLTTWQRRLEAARQLVRQHVKPGRSLADELIRERRRAARNE